MMLAKIKPAEEGARVAVPGTEEPLKADGQLVAITTYWRRRIKDQSVVVIKDEPKSAKAAAKKKD